MPELPEVENVKRQLEGLLELPRAVVKIEFFRKDLRFPFPKKLGLEIQNRPLIAITRRAKYLVFQFEHGVMLSHLGMTGSWREADAKTELGTHDHVRVSFEGGRMLVFNDPRRFGYLDWQSLTAKKNPWFDHLGPEPLSDDFTAESLFAALRKRKAAVKVLLMDQKIVVGVGNIYASEALFRAGVRPGRAASRVTLKECERIVTAIREVLTESIDAGGSTISDYRHADGGSGAFQDRFRVYDRKHQPCYKCGTKISMRVLAGRSTYWCAQCQK